MIFSIVVEKDQGVYSKLVILKNNNQINSGYELFEKWKQDISLKDRIMGKHTYLYFKISNDSNIIEIISLDYFLDFKDHIKVFFKTDEIKLSFLDFMINSFINSDKFPKNKIIESISKKIGDVEILIEVDNNDLIGFSLSCNKNNIISFAFLCNLVDYMKIFLINYYKDKLGPYEDPYEIRLTRFLYSKLIYPLIITRWSSF